MAINQKRHKPMFSITIEKDVLEWNIEAKGGKLVIVVKHIMQARLCQRNEN